MADMTAAAEVKAPPATRAYVTFLADDGADRFNGVVGLAKALRNAGSAYPLVVAVLPDVPESRRRILMDDLGCIVREVEPVSPRDFSKLRIWEFVEYEQMMYLEAGFQGALENIDGQFEPEHGAPPAPDFSADMFVYKPSMATAKVLLHAVGVLTNPPAPPNTVGNQEALDQIKLAWEEYKPILLQDELGVAMRSPDDQNVELADDTKQQWTDKLPEFSSCLRTAKQVVFFGYYYAFFMAAFAVVTTYLGD